MANVYFNYPAASVSIPGGLDANIFDSAGNTLGSTSGSLNVNITGGGTTSPSVGPTGSAVPADADYIGGKAQTGNLIGLNLDNSGNLFALPLPTGAATAALQTTGNGVLGSILLDLTNGTQLTGITGTVPLPTGAATSALQTALNAQIPTTLGQKVMASSLAVTIASDQTAIPITGSITATNPSVGATGSTIPASATYIGGLNGGNLKGLALDASGNLGALPLPTGAATAALQTALNAQIPTTLGSKTSANSLAVVIASDQAAFSIKAPVNTNGSNTDSTVSTVATLTAPANTVGFILMNLDTSTANVRWRIGATATSSSGQQLQVGRDTGYVPCAANISICAESGTQNYNIQWVLSS